MIRSRRIKAFFVVVLCCVPFFSGCSGSGGGEEGVSEGGTQQQPGFLSVTTVPSGAAIYLNGENRGVSPILINGVPAGTYALKVSMNLYKDKEQYVVVEENKTTSVSISLELKVGSLSITMEEPKSATVYLNNENKGAANPTLLINNIPIGTHTLKISPNSNQYKEKEQTIDVEEDKTTLVPITLEASSNPVLPF